jgi:hypothetical protein
MWCRNNYQHRQVLVWKAVHYGRMSESEKKMIVSEVGQFAIQLTQVTTTDCVPNLVLIWHRRVCPGQHPPRAAKPFRRPLPRPYCR